MFWAGRIFLCPLLWDVVTEGNEDFERAESENCCYENMKAKYDLSTVSNPIKCKIPLPISVYYSSCVESESFMVLKQRLSWISLLLFHLHLVFRYVQQGTKQRYFIKQRLFLSFFSEHIAFINDDCFLCRPTKVRVGSSSFDIQYNRIYK